MALSIFALLLVNDGEARQLSGEFSLVKAARSILTMGPKFLIIKKGEHGALLFHEEHVFFAPALPLEDVFDPTGAGDTFAGGFFGYLTAMNQKPDFESMKKACVVGTMCSSHTIQNFGIKGIVEVNKEKLKARFAEFKKSVGLLDPGF